MAAYAAEFLALNVWYQTCSTIVWQYGGKYCRFKCGIKLGDDYVKTGKWAAAVTAVCCCILLVLGGCTDEHTGERDTSGATEQEAKSNELSECIQDLEGKMAERDERIEVLQSQLEEEEKKMEDLQTQLQEAKVEYTCYGVLPNGITPETLREDLRTHTELIPFEAVAGGTNSFQGINILSKECVHALAGDDHIYADLFLEYTVQTDGTIEWTLLYYRMRRFL